MKEVFNIPTVLIAPLDWGLGHVTRCIPLIKAFKQLNWRVIIATNATGKIVLQKEFTDIEFEELKGYNIKYSKSAATFSLKILTQIPKIFAIIKYEHNWLQKIIDKHAINLVVSDNRYGLYSTKATCVFITHQLKIKAKFSFTEKLLQLNNYWHIQRFNYCWIPDCADANNLTGDMGHPIKMPAIKTFYMGLLSRFNKSNSTKIKYKYCISLSGPEPQRTILEKMILQQINQLQEKVLVVRGLPKSDELIEVAKNVEIKNHLTGADLEQAFLESEYIICRSGYTTMMEIITLQKKAILIPTPKQTEQEYLAKIAFTKNWCYTIPQSKFNLSKAVIAAEEFNYQIPTNLSVFTATTLQHILAMQMQKF